MEEAGSAARRNLYFILLLLLLLLFFDHTMGHVNPRPAVKIWSLNHWITREAPQRDLFKSESEVAQSCLTLCDPMDCSLPGSSVHGIFQARILEWVAMSFSRQSSI